MTAKSGWRSDVGRSPKETESDGVLLKNRLGHDFREGVGRGQYAKSDGVLLENRLGHHFREVGGRVNMPKVIECCSKTSFPGTRKTVNMVKMVKTIVLK